MTETGIVFCARKAADGAIATAKAELVHQGTMAGVNVVLVDPKYTTTDCSSCGARAKHRLSLGERIYTCQCGNIRPRDKNSAITMMVRAGFIPASAEGVRPEGFAEADGQPELGIPRL